MRALQATRGLFATAKGDGELHARIHCPDGTWRDMGRVDRKVFRLQVGRRVLIPGFFWAPRAHWYRYVTLPRLKRIYGEDSG